MSNGNIDNDLRVATNTSCGPALIGMRYVKIWSGGDSARPHVNENVYTAYIHSSYDPALTWYEVSSPNAIYTGSYLSCFGGASFEVSWDSNDQIHLLSKLVSDIKKHKFDASVAVGESRRSLEMIKDRSVSLYRALSHLKRGDLSSFARSLRVRSKHQERLYESKDIAKLFLEYEYGWRPLINDVYEGSNAVFALTNRPLTRAYHARHRVNGIVRTAAWGFQIPGTCFISKDLRVEVAEDYSPLASLGLENPATVAWELLPYSFIADWFIPIGKYLGVRSALGSLRPASVWETEMKRQEACTLKVHPNLVVLSEYPYVSKTLDIKRRVTTLSVPTPRSKDFSKIPTWRHALDSVSLLVARFGTKKLFSVDTKTYTE